MAPSPAGNPAHCLHGVDWVRFTNWFWLGELLLWEWDSQGFNVQGWRGSWEGGVPTVMKEMPTPLAPSYTLHGFPEKQSIFRYVWTALDAVCLPCLSLPPPLSLPLSWLTETLSKHKHLSGDWQRGSWLISLTSSLFPLFPRLSSLSVRLLLFRIVLLSELLHNSHPLSLSLPEFLLSLFTSPTPPFTLFPGWLLTPPCWLESTAAAKTEGHYSLFAIQFPALPPASFFIK